MAAERWDPVEGADGGAGHVGPAIEGDDMAEENFFRDESCLVDHLLEDLLHFLESLVSAKLADDEVVGSGAVAEGLRGLGAWVRVFEEVEGDVRVFLEAEEGG